MDTNIKDAADAQPAHTDPPDRHPAALPDAKIGFLHRICPTKFLPYVELARLDRPIGWQLLLMPCCWSLGLAAIHAHTMPDGARIVLFLIGAIAMRGAGSTYNDILDRKLDAKVARTAARPLPSGRISVAKAALFLAFEALIGLGVLLCLAPFAQILGLLSLVPVAIYPLMKRITNWPQLVLGLAFSWGALLGWADQFGALSAAPFWLYAGAVFWTMGYDTIYALQDTRDDAIVGIGSTARRFGAYVRLGVTFFYACAMACLTIAIALAGGFIIANLAALAFALHLFWQCRQLDDVSPKVALKLFRANRDAGLILALGLFTEALLRALFPHVFWLGLPL